MSWPLLLGLLVGLGILCLALVLRRRELTQMRASMERRSQAKAAGADQAQLQFPAVDLSRCAGCGTCVAVCPEGGVLELVHGQAVVVNGARCVGVAACQRECPVDAITVGLHGAAERDDIPNITPSLQAVGQPGLYLAGEVTAHALIKTAVDHGTKVAQEVAGTPPAAAASSSDDDQVLDLCIIGAGPAGLACALEAHRLGLRALTLEQENEIGGTVAKYPRRKLVLTQPIDLPLHGRLRQNRYTKEDLIHLWRQIASEQDLPIATGQTYRDLHRHDDGVFEVTTDHGRFLAHNVCVAIGRRGIPRRLGVPGEELPKVSYDLVDPRAYQDRALLVVGGGDSAVETAIALAEQPGNKVTLSYRQQSFFRIKQSNEQRLQPLVEAGTLRVVLGSEVCSIHADHAVLQIQEPHARSGAGGVAEATTRKVKLHNDEVFVMIGGTPPTELLGRAGVSFDPAEREDLAPDAGEQGTGLFRALSIGAVLTALTLGFVCWHGDYYLADSASRAANPKHAFLRPGRALGLWLGIAATALILVNLLYLLRRSPRSRLQFGSLRTWMTSHVATGILAFLAAVVHAGMAPEQTAGGHAFWALGILLVTGAIGRYFYAYVPRAANGRELELAEARAGLDATLPPSGPHAVFHQQAQGELHRLIEGKPWQRTFVGRLLGLLSAQRDLRTTLHRLAIAGADQGVEPARVAETCRLTRQACRSALMIAHFEDLRGILATWRYLHRWLAWLMVLLVVVHVVQVLAYGAVFFGGHR